MHLDNIEKAVNYSSVKEFTEKGRIMREIENETRQATGIAKANEVYEKGCEDGKTYCISDKIKEGETEETLALTP